MGTIVKRSSSHGYTGHINTSGVLTWISASDLLGVLVDSNASSGQENISMISGGNGTALLTWTDGATYTYIQNIASNGSLPWGAKPASIAANTSGEVLTTDDNGGAIVAWTQGLQNGLNIFAQHVNSSGQPVWWDPTYGTSGNPVSTTPSTYQEHPVIVSDDAGGAIVAWYHLRASSYGGPFDIYAQHIAANGGVTKVNTQVSAVATEFSLSKLSQPVQPVDDDSVYRSINRARCVEGVQRSGTGSCNAFQWRSDGRSKSQGAVQRIEPRKRGLTLAAGV